MGSAQQLTPFPRPLGVFPEFFAKQSETLVLREKLWSLSGNAFDIQLASGQSFLKVKGEAFSISNRMNVTDMSGKFLFCIRQKLLSLHTTYYAEDANGNEILEVRSKFKLTGSKFIGTLMSASGQQEELMLIGDWKDRNAQITDATTGQVVAAIRRDRWNAREILGGQQTYNVTVAPNVDMTIIVAMCICLDVKKNEPTSGGGVSGAVG